MKKILDDLRVASQKWNRLKCEIIHKKKQNVSSCSSEASTDFSRYHFFRILLIDWNNYDEFTLRLFFLSFHSPLSLFSLVFFCVENNKAYFLH